MSDAQHQSAQAFKAFVDASAGAVGALFAAVLLYPLDVVKTRQQVAVDDAPATDAHAALAHRKQESNMWRTCWLIYRAEGLEGLFAGLSSKMVHTYVSNFAYFYWFSFLKQAAARRSAKPVGTGLSLAIGSLAGALNMTMTLPLEMINTRAQILPSDSESESDIESESDSEAAGGERKTAPPAPHHKSMLELAREIYAEDGVLSFWKGFVPSLVLVTNPSINFTIFDKLKLRVQTAKMAAAGASRLASLTALEAFVIAAIAKAIATLLTYPIIRAKVLMQAQKKHNEAAAAAAETSGTQQQPPHPHPHHHHHHHADMGNSMLQVLKRIGELEGPGGYFKGCSAQLFNTVLKSALLVMTKEQITKYTMRVLYALRKSPAKALK
ncbi:hypothetical protein PybrP1_012294 [[Pythium] brassicae (nom. inval.)]|nr:hypothetical protein PybrP1_012294 [[Pythium] brassicae (nom. inval.)]